ncbi:MAG: hypothetical protein QXD03_05815, partial [Candidatus Anstonellales archaeon]
MIAVVFDINKNDVLGFRVFDVVDNKYKDVAYKALLGAMQKNLIQIGNLGLVDGKIVGTNGSIDRYSKIDIQGKLVSKNAPLVIINQIGDVGYTVVDYKGNVKKVKIADVVNYAKQYGIANGKVVMREGVDFISSINGSYEVISIDEVKKAVVSSGVDVRIKVANLGKSNIVKQASVEAEINIETNDVFNCLTNSQRLAIKNYYMWYTVEKYREFSNDIGLAVAVGKAEKLAKLRGDREWEFAGIWDTGAFGNGRCELGHPLRYVYYAVPTDYTDFDLECIKFGETCASDFFNISKEDMDKLVKTRQIMSEEIEMILDVIVNSSVEVYRNEKLSLFYDVIDKLIEKDKLVYMFGKDLARYITEFRVTNLPIPMSMVIRSSSIIARDVRKLVDILFSGY